MKRGPFYLVSAHDVQAVTEACMSIDRLRSNGREEDEITIAVFKYVWPSEEGYDLQIVEKNSDDYSKWTTEYFPDAKELGEYDLHYHFHPYRFFEYAVAEGWLD